MQQNMQKVQVIFAKGRHPYSYLIRLRYQSRWSHVGVIIGNDVHEAESPAGVVTTPLHEFISRYGADRVAVAEAWAEPGWQQRAQQLLGTPYDFWGAFGMGIGTRKLDDPNALWCSHHVGIVLGTYRPERMNRLSPEHIWMNSKEQLQAELPCPG